MTSPAEQMREACARVCDDASEGARRLHNLAAKDHDRAGCNTHAEAWRVAVHLAAAIRALPAPDDWQGVESDQAEYAIYEVRGDEEMEVAGCSGPADRALAEAMHYAAMYGQDGPVRVERVYRVPFPLPAVTSPEGSGDA